MKKNMGKHGVLPIILRCLFPCQIFPGRHQSKRFLTKHFLVLSGKYTFAISSDDTSELWLSTDENPAHVRLKAWVGNRTALSGVYRTHVAQFDKYNAQVSSPIYLRHGQKYFIEVLHKQGKGREHLLVGWKIPGSSYFQHLTRESISLFIDDSITQDVTAYSEYIPQDLPSHSHSKFSSLTLDQRVHMFGAHDERDTLHRASFISEEDVAEILPSCPYKPSYLVGFRLHRYDGVKLIHDTSVFPDDHSDLTHMKEYDNCALRRLRDSHGNYMTSLPTNFLSNHSLYENGSIRIFSGERLAALGLPKDAQEIIDAGDALLERQLDLLDMRKAADVQVMSRKTEAPETRQPSESSLHFEASEIKATRGKVLNNGVKYSASKQYVGKTSKAKPVLAGKRELAVKKTSHRKQTSEAKDGHFVEKQSPRRGESSKKRESDKSSSWKSNKSRKLLSFSPTDGDHNKATKGMCVSVIVPH